MGCSEVVVSKFKKSVLCFQETKVSECSKLFIHSVAGSFVDKCYFIPSTGASGGLITYWNSRVFSCSEVLFRPHSLTVRLTHIGSAFSFYLTNVYGSPSWDGKEDFCRDLVALKGVCRDRWVICGDFNFTKTQDERNGKVWSVN